jgi:membrane protein involved in colicin uptake
MATIEQATMPYAITALKGHKELRDKATPPLTMKELNDAEARAAAVVTLLTSVNSASAKGEKPDDFIKNNAAAILATGLSNDDVKTMFSAVTLKGTLDTARADAEAAGKTAKEEAVKEKKTDKERAAAEKAATEKSVQESIDAIPTADRLGLGEGSLKAYTNKPGNWGENRAGWQRKAVASMPGNIGSRIEAVAVSDNGTALALPVIKTRVNAQLAKKPVPSLEEIVKVVAQQNNPGEKNYGKHVWETYDRLYD